MSSRSPRLTHRSVLSWLDSSAGETAATDAGLVGIDWIRLVPFALLHLVCLGVIWVGWSPIAVGVALAMYAIRMVFLTSFYHRYFSHRTFQTSRLGQFVFAILGNMAVQKGPLWWAAHHRRHHRYSDQEGDPHSPILYNFFYSHMGWILMRSACPTDVAAVPDLHKYPELRLLNRFDTAVPILLASALFGLGALLEWQAPGLGTTGGQMLIWGFFISTIMLFHGSVMINSVAHLIGRRRFATTDKSRNSFGLALLTMGEGWHNNHHYYQGSARQGFYWWEIDVSYYFLRTLGALGIIWDIHPVPASVLALGARRKRAPESRPAGFRPSIPRVEPTP